ncbi:MAG: hypothetical protein K9G41_01665 [Flavobacteriales bacterium]|nr:hypothetical protein [Flavobacteriales bacterium]
MKATPVKNNLLIVLLVFVLCFLSRLLFVNSNVFFFDGDEAIVALMGLDILDGNFPLYFYGQNYGLSIVEALLISVGILLFGTTMLAVKLPMLLLWSGAISLMALSFFKLSKQNKIATILFIAVMILSPTWLVWSMKARGGYLTSFFFASLVTFLLIQYQERLNAIIWLVIGLSLALVYEAQPIWLPCLLPVMAYFLLQQEGKLSEKVKSAGAFVLGAGIPLAAFAYVKSTIEVAWDTPKPNFVKRLELLGDLPDLLLKNLGGNYFLSTNYEPSNKSYATIFIVVFLALAALGIYRVVKERRLNLSSVFLLASMFSFSGFLVKSEPRYLLPFFGFALFTMVAVFTETENGNIRKGMLGASVILCLMGLAALPNFNKYSFVNMSLTEVDRQIKNDEAVMDKLIRKFKADGVKYVFTTNEFLQHQLNYMSNKELLVIGRKDRCRTPENVEAIMAAYPEHASEFAIIGYNFRYGYTGKIPLVDNKIFYIIRPDKQTLEQVGFFK